MNLDLIGCKNLIFILSYTQHLGIQMVMIFLMPARACYKKQKINF